MPRPLIVALAGDPGPAAALAPVIEHLADQPWAKVECLAYAQSHRLWAERGIAARMLDPEPSPAACAGLLDRAGTGLLLMGASYNRAMLELRFLAAAQGLGLPSLCLLDYPARYWARFTSPEGARAALPTLIAVGDEQTRAEMIAEGFPPERLAVSGLPALDRLAGFRDSFGPAQRQRARQALGAGPSDLLVLFASQPLRDFFQVRPGQLAEAGYDEAQVLGLVLRALETLSAETAAAIRLVLRPHPREDRAPLAQARGENVTVTLDDGLPAWEAVCAADLVVGMSSMLLMEACHLGVATMSVQPGLASPDTLPTNRAGLSNPVYDQAGVLPALRRLLLDERARAEARARLAGLSTDGQAAARAAGLVRRLLGLEQSRRAQPWQP